MKIEIFVSDNVEFTSELGKSFDVITAKASDDAKIVSVDKTISPAILINGQVILKGSVQVLQPSKNIDYSTPKQEEITNFEKLNNLNKDENK